jgi:hypothetical protein
MEKIFSLLVIGILVISIYNTNAVTNKDENLIFKEIETILSTISSEKTNIKNLTFYFKFGKPEIIEGEKYVELKVEGTKGLLCHFGHPILPIYTQNISFAFGTKIIDIDYKIQDVKEMILSKKIVPSPPPIISNFKKNYMKEQINESVYNTNDFYPGKWFNYYLGGGIYKRNLSIFCIPRVYPVQYNPRSNTLQYIKNLNVTISYIEPTNLLPSTSLFDLVIITPSLFLEYAKKLAEHKRECGINTTIKTTEEIYKEYTGIDKPEQIKYFIKDSIENWNSKYVILLGGLKSVFMANPRDDRNQGTEDWYIPVRYTNLREKGMIYDPGYISDLYYADIYDGYGNFSNWDSNGDGIFAKWTGSGIDRDIIDLYPDVYVGRLACRNQFEVNIMVNKIINYECTPSNPLWYNKMVVVGGDAFNDSGTDFIEGELIGDKVISYMPNFEPIKLYGSNRYNNPEYTPLTKNIMREIDNGCGHLFFDGHAHPGNWNTGWPGEFDRLISGGGISIYDFPFLRNNKKLPICVVGGCHNSQFNVSFFSTLLKKPFMWTFGIPVPECWSWHLTRKIGGGSIATIGNTGLGYEAGWEYGDRDGDGINEPDCVEAYGGYLERCFYSTFNESIDILGEIWGGAINKYLNVYPGMDFQWDAKVIEEWVLLGDPSLKIEGYNQIIIPDI